MQSGGYDVRAIANFVLDVADRQGSTVTNLALNKIIYFLHASFLHEFQKPLVSAKIEAWDHGPVFREVYHQFKQYGRSTIHSRAKRLSVQTGRYEEVETELSPVESSFLEQRCVELLKISPGKLVDMSHVEDGPWHRARFGSGRVNPGMEITNEAILALAVNQSRH